MNNAEMFHLPLLAKPVPAAELEQTGDSLYEKRLEALAWMRQKQIEWVGDPSRENERE